MPTNSFYRQVFARGSNIDRMSLTLEQSDQLQGVNADRSLRPAVAFCIVMRVTNQA
jgi:hypothetical protein